MLGHHTHQAHTHIHPHHVSTTSKQHAGECVCLLEETFYSEMFFAHFSLFSFMSFVFQNVAGMEETLEIRDSDIRELHERLEEQERRSAERSACQHFLFAMAVLSRKDPATLTLRFLLTCYAATSFLFYLSFRLS